MAFTLEQLAHFDRCLFPDDIAEEIGQVAGYSDTEILLLKMDLRRKTNRGATPLGVVSMFQERINDKQFCDALSQVLTAFCNKHWPT